MHATPAAVLFSPGLVQKLYGVSGDGDMGIILAHRGALFLAVIAAAGYALVVPSARQTASPVAAISVIGFLIVYARAGMPVGPLRTIALADLIALVPLALVSIDAWFS